MSFSPQRAHARSTVETATLFAREHALREKFLRQVALLRRVQPPGEKCGLRGWRRLKRDPPKVGKGEKISTKGAKVSVKGAKDESAKGFQGVGKDSKGVREGPPRTLRFSTNAHSIIEPVSFLCSRFSSCLSCLSCVSMFNYVENRFNGTRPLVPIGHEGS